MVKNVMVNGRLIGGSAPCFIIAEAGVNHNGDLELAKRLIEVAAAAGADAVKFQTFRSESLVSSAAPKARYQEETTGKGESQLHMLKKLELSQEAYGILRDACREKNILFMSTPFDEACADFLEELDVALYKIPSGELNNPFLLRHVAQKGKPMIISTGMGNLDEVEAAVRTVREEGNDGIILLHCVSQYPAPCEDANLRAMETMRKTLKVPVGFSDHTLGIEVALAAVALGASVIEKHFTLDRSLSGPDHRASLEPGELRQLIRGIRNVERAIGDGIKEPRGGELETARVARKSIVAKRNIPCGSRLALEAVVLQRPGTGLPPAMLPRLVGLKAKKNIPAGTLLCLEMFE